MWVHTLFCESKLPEKLNLSIIVKGTWTISTCGRTFADKPIPIYTSDILEFPDDPFKTDTIVEADLTGYKKSTDVIISGKAHAPAGKKAYNLICSVQVGQMKKSMIVFGQRRVRSKVFRSLCISDPVPFTEKVIGYKNAYGGTVMALDGTIFSYYPNPIGKGFVVKGCFESFDSIELPTQEDPEELLTEEKLILKKYSDWIYAPKPVSFGWTGRNFYPRYKYAGIQNSEGNFYQGASEGLFAVRLNGGEHATMINLDSQNSVFEFDLPDKTPVVVVKRGAGKIEPGSELQTVVIDMERKTITMTWRAMIENIEKGELSTKFLYEVY